MKKRTAMLLLLGLLLTGCARTLPPETTAPATTAAPQTKPSEATEPITEPTTEPAEPALAPGGCVKVSGRELSTYRTDAADSRDFVSLPDFADASGIALTEQGGKVYRDGDALAGVTVLERRDGTYVPVSELGAALGLDCYEDQDRKTTYFYERPGTRDLPDGIYVPILMYHATGDDLWGVPELFVSTADLEDQFRYLLDNGYTPIFFSDLGRVTEFQKPVILSFDDGYDDNYRELFPLVQKYGVKVNIAVITGYIGGGHSLKEDEIREMWDSGLVSFLSHTVSHPFLTELGQEELEEELERSRLTLLRLTGTMPSVLVYPNGDNDEGVREAAARYYDMGVIMTDGRCYVTGNDPYVVSRDYVSRYTSLEEFAGMISWAGMTE